MTTSFDTPNADNAEEPDHPAHPGTSVGIEYRLLATLAPQQRRQVEGLLRPLRARAGEIVVTKGAPADALYLVARGEVEVLSADDGFRLTTVHAGQDFGSVALLNGAPRSASVRAVTDVDLRVLSIDDLRALSNETTDSAYVVLLKNLLIDQGADLQRSSDNLVQSLRQQVAEARTRLAMGSLIGFVIFIMCLYGFFLRDSVMVVSTQQGSSTPISTLILVVYLVTLYVLIRRSGLPLRTYGLTWLGWQQSVIEALLWSVALLAVGLLAKWIAIRWVPGWRGQPLFKGPALGESNTVTYAALYLLFAPAQEFMARGVLQSSFQEFLDGRWVTTRAILYSTMLFSATHLHLSTGFALLVLIPSVFWGILYARHRTLIGVSLSHILVGGCMFFCIGIPGAG